MVCIKQVVHFNRNHTNKALLYAMKIAVLTTELSKAQGMQHYLFTAQ